MLIDLHVHSPATPGCTLQPAQVLARAAERGLDAVAFTDLGSLSAASELLDAGKGAPVAVFVGVELATDHGHYLAFFADPTQVPEPAQLFGDGRGKPWPTRDVLERVTALGGVAVAAFPYDRDIDHPSGDYIFGLKAHLAAVEGLNAQRKPGTNDLAVEASSHLGLSCTGGSSAMTSLDEVGRAATFFAAPIATHAELVAALRSGQFFPVGAGRPPPLSEMAKAVRAPTERFDRPDRGGRDRGGRGGDRRGGRGHRRGGRDRR